MQPTDNGKLLAALSYGGFFVGFPLGVIPLVQRDDEFALYHARHATAVWLVSFVLITVLSVFYTFATFVTCGMGAILFPIVLLPVPWVMVVGIHGLVLALNGEMAEPMGTFGLGDMMFSGIELKDPAEKPAPAPEPEPEPEPENEEPPPLDA